MIRPIRRARPWMLAVAGLALVGAACTAGAPSEPASPTTTATATPAATEIPPADACATLHPAMLEASFVLVTAPSGGAAITPGQVVAGCSRTFESHVDWRLLDRAGDVVASGFTMGGGVDGAAPFEFDIGPYTVAEAQVGHLEVAAPDPSAGEGFPPSTHRIPVVLLP